MRTQVERRPVRRRRDDGALATETGHPDSGARATDLKDELDGILDEIDSLLEENAEEFVQAYVQKGGE